MRRASGHAVDVPHAVRKKVRALGAPGRRWLRDLPGIVRALEREWEVTLGAPLAGGSAAYVIEATTAEGVPAVLKIHLPGYDDVTTEIRVLRIAAGRGYARLLRADEARGALLLERLGPPLSRLGFPIRTQIEIICATLAQAWVRAPEVATFPSGAAKAHWLRDFIVATWQALGRPCPEQVVEQALACGAARAAAFDPARAVLVHGDAHAGNTLAPFGGAGSATAGFKCIDPDGLFAERAYDLGILMRGWIGDVPADDALRLGQERCAHLSELTGEDREAIWQWGFIERVSTGLLLLRTGNERAGHDFLRVAAAWAQR